MKIEVKKIHMETDINNQLRIILTLEDGTEYVLSDEATSFGYVTKVTKKTDCFYFNDANRIP